MRAHDAAASRNTLIVLHNGLLVHPAWQMHAVALPVREDPFRLERQNEPIEITQKLTVPARDCAPPKPRSRTDAPVAYGQSQSGYPSSDN